MNTINIIGSGINGMLSAHELHKKGFEVTIFDRQNAAQESTWAGGGIISPLFPWRYDDSITELSLLSQSIYPNILEELKVHSDIDPELLHSGMLMLDCKDKAQARQWKKQFSITLEEIEGQSIQQQFNALNKNFEHAFWMPQIHQIRNPRFAQLMLESLKKQGIKIKENTEISAFNIDSNHIRSVSTNHGDFSADKTLVCAGAWSGDLINTLQCDDESSVEINPVHGQMLLLKLDKPIFSPIILHDGRYIIPRKDGHVLVGSTTEMIGFKKQTTKAVRESLMEYAIQTIPQLKDAPIVNHWSGLRPGSVKGIPKISQHPRINNLYINAGQYRNGLVTAPGSAQLITQIICNSKTSINSQAFAL
ncbi:MAG: glycine oxidase ThiO [Gammaproteobacteria bacterium]|nr:glycine oxidase ThiO [Gammaproteobacteria bacterium]